MPLALAAAFVVSSGSALAQGDDEDRAALLAERHAAMQKKWEAQFRAADTNHDRKLTRAEMEAAGLPRSLIAHFDEIDTDHDGALTPEELMAANDKRLADQHAKDERP